MKTLSTPWDSSIFLTPVLIPKVFAEILWEETVRRVAAIFQHLLRNTYFGKVMDEWG